MGFEPAAVEKTSKPTLLEFMSNVQIEMADSAGLTVEQKPKNEQNRLPKWSMKIVGQLRKTILKPILNLRPKGEINWQNYGKIIGILDRCKTFLLWDLSRFIKDEELDKITHEQWEKLQPKNQLRSYVIQMLKRAVSEDESLDDLVEETIKRKIEFLEKIKVVALLHVSQQGPKNHAMFLKGLEQGYNAFLDVEGKFSGDRGRTEIYTELLSSQHEIEKMRRMLPERTDEDLYDHLKPWYKFPHPKEKALKWLRDVCDDICLSMTGKRGRPHKFLRPKPAITF